MYHGKMFVDYIESRKVGGDWYNATGKHASLLNNFWLEVFSSWKILCKLQKAIWNSDIMQSCIWHYVNISKTPLYLKIWIQHGIIQVGDILDSDGCLLTRETLQKYDFQTDFLDYHRVKINVTKFIEINKQSTEFINLRPSMTFHSKVLYKSNQGCRDFDQIFGNLNSVENVSLSSRFYGSMETQF